MTSFLSTIPATLPAPDKLEVSLFGPGVGECVVLHVGDGRWFVIDSCINRETGNPVAIDYLRHVGVSIQDKVGGVVATHWHDDHTRGLSSILELCSSAKFYCSQALDNPDFQEFVTLSLKAGQEQVGSAEFRKIIDVVFSRSSGPESSKGPEWAMANKLLHRAGQCEVWALSPSSGTISRGLLEISALIPRNGVLRRRAVSNKPNTAALVLGVKMGSVAVILGSDLETGSDMRTGWKAVLALAPYPLPRASVFKIPHHGSKTAHEPDVWTQLLEPTPVSVITPFLAGRTPLPTKTDRQRLVGSSSAAYLTSGTTGRSSAQYSPAVARLIKATAKNLVDVESGMGLVRVRWDSGAPTVECFGKAARLA